MNDELEEVKLSLKNINDLIDVKNWGSRYYKCFDTKLGDVNE